MQQLSNTKSPCVGPIVQKLKRESAKYPYLSAEKEYELAVRYRDLRDEDAKEQLINSHQRLVIKIARAHSGYKVPMADLISEGNVGLIKALNKFDPEMENRFSTYAIWWIRAQIREFSMFSFSHVKIGTTAAQKKLFFNLSRLMQEFDIHQADEISDEHMGMIAETLGVSRKDVLLMSQRLSGCDSSLQARIDNDEGTEYQDLLVDQNNNPEEAFSECEEIIYRRKLLTRAIMNLSERERAIFESRQVLEENQTLNDLSNLFGVSRERIRQIESKAFEKIQKSVRNLIIEQNMTSEGVEAWAT